MPSHPETIRLGAQLIASMVAVLVMTMIHSVGLLAIFRMMWKDTKQLDKRAIDARSILMLGAFGLSLFALHLFEIFLFAVFYMVAGALHSLESALYFSASSYSTLGLPDGVLPHSWRLLAAIEALIGFVLITWSAAFIVSTLDRLRE